jgi:hypothetical protein
VEHEPGGRQTEIPAFELVKDSILAPAARIMVDVCGSSK